MKIPPLQIIALNNKQTHEFEQIVDWRRFFGESECFGARWRAEYGSQAAGHETTRIAERQMISDMRMKLFAPLLMARTERTRLYARL